MLLSSTAFVCTFSRYFGVALVFVTIFSALELVIFSVSTSLTVCMCFNRCYTLVDWCGCGLMTCRLQNILQYCSGNGDASTMRTTLPELHELVSNITVYIVHVWMLLCCLCHLNTLVSVVCVFYSIQWCMCSDSILDVVCYANSITSMALH